mgnify:CR=1 FL=1
MHSGEVRQVDEKIGTEKIKIKIKGYKKFISKIHKMKKEIKKLNREMKRSVELKEKLF